MKRSFDRPVAAPRRAVIASAIGLLFLVASAAAAVANGAAESPAATTAAAASSGPVTIAFWEAYNGALGDTLAHLVDAFNASQTQYKVDAVYKGSYPDVMSATIGAYRANNAPNIAMIFDVGTATMQYSQGVYVPVYKLMKDHNVEVSCPTIRPFDPNFATPTTALPPSRRHNDEGQLHRNVRAPVCVLFYSSS